MTAPPQVNPLPTAHIKTVYPGFICPFDHASSKAIGIEADEVFRIYQCL